ncbi:hypothetical protein GGS21DRAFT_464015 [Xylaria nigripes]|nr:hypothetical protein GGS21DRAFT_464015 [Xylaria nigripes]
MEQFETPDILRSVQSTRPHPSSPIKSQHSASRLHNSEPQPRLPNNQDLSDSVLSLRFPRPVGNRKLTNWISSSSPDIMQPGNLPDDDPSLSELGYDVIGTDGESQAESTTSSLDYQRTDDIQSLMSTDTGTDVYTDSSEDEETALNDNTLNDNLNNTATLNDNPMNGTTISDATVVEEVHYDESGEPETLNMVNRSLESPTNLSLSGASPFTSSSYLDNIRTHDPAAVLRDHSSTFDGPSLPEPESWAAPLTMKELEYSEPRLAQAPRNDGAFRLVIRYIDEKRRILAMISGLVLLYTLALVAKSTLLSSPVPRELSTVPVASVSVAVPSYPGKSTHSAATPSTISQTPNASQAGSSSKSLMFIPFGKDSAQEELATVTLSETVCSAELSGPEQIMITIPQNIKSSWLARDAILVAVSRGLQDIPTKVSLIDQGFLIQVPSKEAHGVLVVTIATTYKPRVHESFSINFGSHRFTEALDVGKQLVRGFAQRVADTMNGTTNWVEGTYIPALDIVSKQVCNHTASVSDSVLYGLRDVSDTILNIPNLIIERIRHALDVKPLLQRANQLQLELARQAEDMRDELGMALLKSQLASKLIWLKIKGETEEYARYISKAKIYWKDQRDRVEAAKVERAGRTKQQVQARREQDRPASKDSLWNLSMGGA